MDLETLWYEISPYLYAVCGLFLLSYGSASGLLKVSGILLIIAALTIVRLRWVYRRALYLNIESVASSPQPARDQNQGQLWEEEPLGGG
ncbi:MAG: hypothetical protein ACR2GP_00250 [Burkholderiaceae bacterium]